MNFLDSLIGLLLFVFLVLSSIPAIICLSVLSLVFLKCHLMLMFAIIELLLILCITNRITNFFWS